MADAISAKTAWALAKAIKGGSKRKGPTNGTATVVRVDQDGTHWVRISGSDVETPVNGAITVDAKAGDTVQYHLEDTRISITGNATSPSVGRDYVGGEVSVVTKQVEAVRASIVETNELVAAKATIGQLEVERARIGELEADHVSVSDFQAEQANIDTLQANTADIDTIRANSAKVQNLTAAQLEADHAKVGQLDVDQIAADHATIGTLDTTYMHADMANADVAWIQNGTIKDGSIVSAMINDVSANKLTAGTINGSVINVTNLNADNITAGTINGQRIGEGSLSLDKLSEDVYTEAEVNTIVDGLNDRIDGAIETHTGTAVPTLNNSPASSWNTMALKDEHVGDVYYVVNSQSQQNGYCYRFTKNGSTYSWQLIKDSDVTAALSRLTTAEGKITTFDSDISKLKTDTGTLTTKTESLETRMSDAESDILDKVDTTTFNEVSDTVDQHSQTISQHTAAISNKADGSTVTAVTNRVSKNEQDISGINTTIGELQDTVETKADGSTVETVSNRLNTVSDTVDGHTQTLTSVQNTLSSKADSSTVSTLTTQVNNVSDTVDGHTSQLSSITTTQTTIQSTLDKTVKSSIQLWFSKANTTAPSKPTSQVTSTSTSGNAWRTVVPAYNASYPHYFYCWQYEYVDGTYGWSAVVRDIAMGESQSTARTADSNASAAVTTANTASTNASTALTTANTANTNASDAKTAAATANTTASEAKTTAETAASDASTAKTNAASAVTTANSANTKANANIKSSVQLWFTKANSTAPNKPTSVVSTSNANTANAWNLVVPVWNSSYPHYFYCYQQQKGDGTYQWTDVVYDRATSEAQQLANTTSTNLSTLQTNYATFKQQTEQFESTVGTTYATKTELKGATDDITELEGRVSTNETSISNNASAIALKADSSDVYTKSGVDGLISTEVTNRNAAITAKANEITSSVSETYATKSSVNGKADASDVTALAGRVTTAESNITQNANNIALKVSESDVTGNYLVGKINLNSTTASIAAQRINLQGAVTISDLSSDAQSATLNSNITIGGRNLLTGTDVWLTTFNSYSSCGKSSETIPAGSVVTVSVEVNADNLMWDTTSSTHRIGFETHLTKTGGGYQYLGVWAGNAISEPLNVVEAFTGSIHKRISKTFTLLGDFEVGGSGYIYTQGVAQGTVKVGRPKIEYGNKATDWTPAPEDVDSAISDAAKTATSYVTDITGGGIMVHPSTDATSGVRITSDVDIMRSGTSAINIGANDAVRIGVDDNAHVKMLLESDSMEIDNESGNEIFSVDSGSTGSATVALTASLVTWSTTASVDTDSHHVSDTGTAAGTTTVTATVNGTGYTLDSTYATATVTAGTGVNVALTDAGVTYVRGLMVETVEGEDGSVTTTYPCELSVEYQHAVADRASLSLVGSQTAYGEGSGIVSVINEKWSSSHQSNTSVSVENATTGKAVQLLVGSSGHTRGLFDTSKNEFIIFRSADDKTVINGPNFSVAANGNFRSVGTADLTNLSMTGWVRKLTSDWSSSNQKATFLWTENSVTGQKLAFGITNNGYHRGIYDGSDSRWIVVKYQSGQVMYYGIYSNFEVDAATILSGSTSISAGGIQTGTTSITKSGWYPIAISGWNANSRYALPARLYLSARGNGTGTISWGIYNPDSTNARSPTVTVYVLWARGN